MIPKTLAVIVLLALSACAAHHDTAHCPREGGIGGTGSCIAPHRQPPSPSTDSPAAP